MTTRLAVSLWLAPAVSWPCAWLNPQRAPCGCYSDGTELGSVAAGAEGEESICPGLCCSWCWPKVISCSALALLKLSHEFFVSLAIRGAGTRDLPKQQGEVTVGHCGFPARGESGDQRARNLGALRARSNPPSCSDLIPVPSGAGLHQRNAVLVLISQVNPQH